MQNQAPSSCDPAGYAASPHAISRQVPHVDLASTIMPWQQLAAGAERSVVVGFSVEQVHEKQGFVHAPLPQSCGGSAAFHLVTDLRAHLVGFSKDFGFVPFELCGVKEYLRTGLRGSYVHQLCKKSLVHRTTPNNQSRLVSALTHWRPSPPLRRTVPQTPP